MDTSKLKKFAVEARKSLMGTVSAKLKLVLAENSFERRNSPIAIKSLETLIREIGEEQTIEKVAYTWFNRFIALRFMDVNHYTRIGVVSPVEGQMQPEVLSEAKAGYIDTNVVPEDVKQRILGLLDGAISSPKPQEEVYRLLLVSYCNSWNKQLPFMFEKIKDYTELLMPDDLLSESSVLTQTVETLDAEICKDVEVIGWLYQYYISEKKDQVFAGLKKGKKITKDDVPAATQIFTPDWIVKYMVENSVGKTWLESHPDKDLQSKFKYYLESAEQEDDVKAKLHELINTSLKPQEIKVLDPACGSGHILVKAFEVLFEIYKSQGWQENEIPEMILKHNIYGLDICDRAAQLSQLAVMMKARAYDRNIFNKVTELNICSIQDTNWLDFAIADELLVGTKNKDKATKQIKLLQETFKDAKEYGSIIKVKGLDFDFWEERIKYFNQKTENTLYGDIIKGRLSFIIKQAKVMQQCYQCVVANPPYMSSKGMSEKLSEYVKKNYARSKGDMFAVFKEVIFNFTERDCFSATINQHSWMFLSSYEELRTYMLSNVVIDTMLHLGARAFEEIGGEVVQTTTYITRKFREFDYIGRFVRLIDYADAKLKETKYLERNNQDVYTCKTEGFSSIPGSPIAYWASDRVRRLFVEHNNLRKTIDIKQGCSTSDNERFLRHWNEVSLKKIGFGYASGDEAKESRKKWFPYNKGGEFRKWYGNNDYIVNFYNDGEEMKEFQSHLNQGWTARIKSREFYFKESGTWSFIGADLGVRYSYPGAVFDVAGSSVFSDTILKYIIGFLCSKITSNLLKMLNPTMNFQVENVNALPIIICESKKQQIDALVEQNIAISKDDWDSFETSWDFEQHPLIRFKTDGKVANSFNVWAKYKDEQFNQLKDNEEELNRLFIEIYGLQDEMTPDVADKDITVAKADELRDIKSLISYAVGCMFGRYSLDTKGLVYAGGDFDESKYKTFKADTDNAIPVLSDNYFVDDVVERFYNFIKVAFGEEHFDENISYIVNILGKKNSQTADQVLRDYFVKDFYKDHVQMYQKRPIYWMFSSEKNGFNALVYLHRYNKDTVNIVLNEYLREYKNKLSAKIASYASLEFKQETSNADKIKAGKDKNILQISLNEADDYERNILFPLATERKEIDLDDGVKVNYLKFGKALRNIGLKEKA